MRFYDLEVQSNLSGGENTIQQLAEFAEKLEYSGIAICDNFESIEKLEKLRKEIENVKSDVKVMLGVKIRADDPDELNKIINLVRDKVEILIVSGGKYIINRTACENPKVDILAHPEHERYDNGLDVPCMRAATSNSVSIQMNFREILNSFRRNRSHILTHIKKNIELCNQFNAPILLCSGAQSIWDMRSPREIISIANVLGVDLGKAFMAMSDTPQRIIDKNLKTLEGKAFRGVEVVD